MSVAAITDTLPLGRLMPDGTVYAGLSPHTGKPMYTTSADSGPCCTWKNATACATTLDAHGHRDWRLPTKSELDVLFRNRTFIGNFDEAGNDPRGWYWSSSQVLRCLAWSRRFSDGDWDLYSKLLSASVRCSRP